MSDMEMMELRQRTLAMTPDEVQVVVRALPIDAMHTEIRRRYRESEIQLECINKTMAFRLE